MNKKFLFFASAAILFLLPFELRFDVVRAAPNLIRVPQDYSTIQAAVDAASLGDSIQVASGTYYEHVLINKTVALVGEGSNETILDGNGTGTVLHVTANDIQIIGFTIRNGRGMTTEPPYTLFNGILLENSSNISIRSSNITQNSHGINIVNSDHVTLVDSVVSSNSYGILLEDSRDSIISQNTIQGNNSHGVRLHGTSDALCTNNTLKDNVVLENGVQYGGHGISMDGSNENTVSNNTITSNGGDGIRAWRSSGNVFRDNKISSNQQGIWLGRTSPTQDNSSLNTIEQNMIANNGLTGLRFTQSFNNTILCNAVEFHGYGIYTEHSSMNNTFYRNNFLSNTNQLWQDVAGNVWDNGAEGNYWDDYAGEDLNGDGIGDTLTPHLDVDRYPLLAYWTLNKEFNVTWDETTFTVTIESNCTVASLEFNQTLKQISFSVTGPADAFGFCNATIPKTLLSATSPEEWQILVDNMEMTSTQVHNDTHTSLYFTFNLSTHKIKISGTIVPTAEVFPWWIIAAVVAVVGIVAAGAFLWRRRTR